MLHRVVAACLLLSCAGAASAEETPWFVKPAVTGLSLVDGLALSLAGTPVPGADMDTKFHVTPTIMVGRFVAPNVALSFTGGLPPNIDIQGKGSLQPLGKLADTTYGPMVLSVQYHPLPGGRVRPYLGAGIVYMFVFDADDGAFEDVEIDEDIGPVVEAGADFMLNERYGLFLDVKKAFLRTDARGTFGGAPVTARAKLDPWAFSAGAVFRF